MSLSPTPPAAFTAPASIEALEARLAAIPPVLRNRGERYFDEGRVGTLERDGHGFSATVEGSRPYVTEWSWGRRGWANTCTCPMTRDCKHACAAALRFLGEEGAAKAAPDPLAVLRGPRTPWRRARALQALLGERPGTTVHAHMAPFDSILAEADPDLLCWRLAQALPRATGGWLPTPLAPFRERDDLRERWLDRERDDLAARLAAWSAVSGEEAAKSVRFVLDLKRSAQGGIAVQVDALLTTDRGLDQPRTPAQLEQLVREAERRPGILGQEQVEMVEAWVSNLTSEWTDGEDGKLTPLALRRLLEVAGGTPQVTWSPKLDPDLARRFDLAPGSPVVLSGAVADIVPAVVERDGRLVLDFEARWPDGRALPLEEAHVLRPRRPGRARRASLLFGAGAVHPVGEEPPAELIEGLRALGGLVLDADRHGAVLGDLVQRFPTLRSSVEPFLRVTEAQPLVALDLSEDQDRLGIRVLAMPADTAWEPGQEVDPATILQEYTTSRRWERVSPPAPGGDGDGAAARPRLEVLDPARLRPALDWLARTGAREHGGRWTVRLTPKRLDVFDAAWRGRPESARWYCTPAAKRLLVAGRRIAPTLRVRASGVDWFAVEAKWEGEDVVLSDADLALLRRSSATYVRLSSGWVRRDTVEAIDRAADALADLGLEAGPGEQRVSLWQLAQARPESFALLTELAGAGEATAAVEELRARVASFDGLPRATVPAAFHGTLRPYQQTGVDFLAFNSLLGLGAVLADDMGLGKTVQALAWLTWLREREPPPGPALVVSPASVVHNWVREAERFTPSLRVLRLTGGERHAALRNEAAEVDLVITNYALLRRDRAQLEAIPFGAVILDEAQNVKNPVAAVTKAANALSARHRLALTGTPLENRVLDLWSILSFTSPGFLGSRRAFSARHDAPDAPPHLRRLLAARLRPVLLRRMKKQVAPELPPRTEERVDCELLPIQRKLYREHLERGRRILAEMSADPRAAAEKRFEILAVLTRLRQACCHPALVGGPARAPSGKFETLWEILEPLLAEGHKVLLFSQFVKCLELLEPELARRDVPTHLLTGQTNERAREEVVRRFTEDERASVFLVSLKAGGTGLNLTAATYVILFDPWWNPAVEAQAIDRTHRIGQERKVTAFRLLTRGTIEEKIWDLQQRKASLAREILGEDGFARGLTREDFEWLLDPELPAVSNDTYE